MKALTSPPKHFTLEVSFRSVMSKEAMSNVLYTKRALKPKTPTNNREISKLYRSTQSTANQDVLNLEKIQIKPRAQFNPQTAKELIFITRLRLGYRFVTPSRDTYSRVSGFLYEQLISPHPNLLQ